MNSNDTGTQTEESEPDYKKLYEATQTDLENVNISIIIFLVTCSLVTTSI